MVYFSGRRIDLGTEFWTIDPSTDEASVRDIRAGGNSSDPQELIDLNGPLLFSASDWIHGGELWCANEAGSRMVEDLSPGFTGTAIRKLTAFGDYALFFSTGAVLDDELWISDGTAAGTRPVSDIEPGPGGIQPYLMIGYDCGVAFALDLAATGEELWFSASNGASGWDLWRSDATVAGTVLAVTAGIKSNLAVIGSTIYFAADDPATGVELWRSDGTAAGTAMIDDTVPGPDGLEPKNLIPVGMTLFFTAAWPDPGSPFHGSELWRYDEAPRGVAMVKDICPGEAGSNPSQLTANGSRSDTRRSLEQKLRNRA